MLWQRQGSTETTARKRATKSTAASRAVTSWDGCNGQWSRWLQAGSNNAAHHRTALTGHDTAGGSDAYRDASASGDPDHDEHTAADAATAKYQLCGAEIDHHLSACEHEHVELKQSGREQQFKLFFELFELQEIAPILAAGMASAWSSSARPRTTNARPIACITIVAPHMA